MAATCDPRAEIQRVKSTRGDMCYDLRPLQHDRKNAENTMVSHGVDDTTGCITGRPFPPRMPSSVHSVMADSNADQINDESDSPGSRGRSMPHLSRRDSEPVAFIFPRHHPEDATIRSSPPQMIAVDEWRDMEDSWRKTWRKTRKSTNHT